MNIRTQEIYTNNVLFTIGVLHNSKFNYAFILPSNLIKNDQNKLIPIQMTEKIGGKRKFLSK